MIDIDPQQELFTALKLAFEDLGYAVYDGELPPDGTPYPFVYLGDFQQIDDINKSAVFGNVFPTIHVWSNLPKQRGTVSAMLLHLKTACRKLKRTDNFSWDLRNVNQRISSDNTTTTPLLHGILEAEFAFS